MTAELENRYERWSTDALVAFVRDYATTPMVPRLDDKNKLLAAATRLHALYHDLGAASPAPGTRALIEARYELLKSAYVAADFDYPQYAGMTCLIFAFDGTTRVSRDLDKTLDGAKLCAAPPAGQGRRSV